MKKLTVIILSLLLTLGVVGCSSSSDESSNNTTNNEKQEEQTKAATTDDIKALLKDMYIVLKDSDGGTKDCKDELVKYGDKIDESIIANKEYGDEMEVLKDSINSYNLEEISGYVCNILNRIEGTEKYKIEIKTEEQDKNNNTDQNNTGKNQNNNQSTTNQNNNKNTTNQNNSNKNTNKNEEYESGDYGDYTKCPSCGKMTFHPNGYCERCGYKKLNEDGANHDSQCKNCGSATINADGTCPYCGYKN